jgi:anti-sigma factor (TIGR02949 family)
MSQCSHIFLVNTCILSVMQVSTCHEYRDKILRYLDDDLQAQELNDFRNHLKACADCWASLEAEQALSNLLHRSQPLYPVPVALRSRVSAVFMRQHKHDRDKPDNVDPLPALSKLRKACRRSRRIG